MPLTEGERLEATRAEAQAILAMVKKISADARLTDGGWTDLNEGSVDPTEGVPNGVKVRVAIRGYAKAKFQEQDVKVQFQEWIGTLMDRSLIPDQPGLDLIWDRVGFPGFFRWRRAEPFHIEATTPDGVLGILRWVRD